jgi:hypothetical protein
MNDNVIKFRRPEPPREPNPLLRKLAVVAVVIVCLVLAWAYFQFFGTPASS